jgi:hypothetical protein
VKIAAPTPRAAASAPIRPTYVDALMVLISLDGFGGRLQPCWSVSSKVS